MKNESQKNKKHVIFETESDKSMDNSKFRISANPMPISNDSGEIDPANNIFKSSGDSELSKHGVKKKN